MLFPEPGEISLEIAYSAEHRVRQGDRPWIVMSMISTVDGAISLEGNSALLGGPTDRAVFLHLHRGADSVLVGAHTVRQDTYSPLPAHQVLVVASISGDLGRNSQALLASGNTRIVSGDVRDFVKDLPGSISTDKCWPLILLMRCASQSPHDLSEVRVGVSAKVRGLYAIRGIWRMCVKTKDFYFCVIYVHPTTAETFSAKN